MFVADTSTWLGWGLYIVQYIRDEQSVMRGLRYLILSNDYYRLLLLAPALQLKASMVCQYVDMLDTLVVCTGYRQEESFV